MAPNKGMKLTKPGQLRAFAAYPQCWADLGEAMPTRPAGRDWKAWSEGQGSE
jgi:hypothetical protein